MIYLIGSIVLTSYLTLSFKVLERFRIPVLQTIVINHWVCAIVGSLVNAQIPFNGQTLEQPWFRWAALLGFLFISLFNLIGWVTQKMGVAVSSVANKMSLVIPFTFSLYLYNEAVSGFQMGGIIAALTAVLLTCWRNTSEKRSAVAQNKRLLSFLGPFILFGGSGLLDTAIKYAEHHYLNEGNRNDFLITSFAVAASLGTLLLFYLFVTGKHRFQPRCILAGIGIGIPNYFSIWCLLKVLGEYQGRSSAIIPINNMGIVLFSAVMAYLLFSERLSRINVLGIVLAIGAIALIAFG